MALMDIRGSLTPVVASGLASDDETADKIVSIWRVKQKDRAAISNSLGLGHTSFRDCTRQGLDYALARSRFELLKVERESLVRAWDDLRPWPEAAEVVESIKLRGYKTAILSNGDQDMLEAAARNFGSNIDHILSAEMAGAYKPSPKVYQLPAHQLNISTNETVHVAGSPNDVLGAQVSGIRCFWSNRENDKVLDPAYSETWKVKNLRGILDLI